MADHRSSIDVTTLAEVQRLLASTEFASIDDLARRSGVIDLGDTVDLVGAPLPSRGPSAGSLDVDASSPLPRRR